MVEDVCEEKEMAGLLTAKARLVYEDIAALGGGKVAERAILARTGLSHGSFSAARKELVEAGELSLVKDGRQTVYVLGKKAGAPPALPFASAAEPPAVPDPATEAADGVMLAAVEEMPRVTGDFADFDDWEEALTEQLGSCLDISEGLTGGEYTVYSHAYEQAASYVVQATAAGIRVV